MGVIVTDRRRGVRFAVAAAFVFLAFLLTLLLLPKAAAGAVVSVKATPSAFSPNGDRVLDTVKLSVRLAASAKLFVGIYDERGRLVQTLQRPRSFGAGARAYTWNGLLRGKPRASGVYTVRAKARIAGRARTAKCRVTLNVLPPEILLTSGGSVRVFGGADSAFGYATSGARPAKIQLQIFTATGADGSGGVQVGAATAATAAAAGTVSWNGVDATGAFLPNGRYKVRVVATDPAGNSGASQFEPISVYAPTAVAGTVRDAVGNPVAGATVGVAGTSLTTTTAADGSFAFTACPMGFRDLIATKAGQPDGRRHVKVNLETGPIELILGRNAATVRDRDVPSVTISGTLQYRNDSDTAIPMRNVRVLVQDDATFGWDDLYETSTDADGHFSITYDPDDPWELWGHPDIRVVAYCEDGGRTVGEVRDGWASLEPYSVVVGGTWQDNTASRNGLLYIEESSQKLIWWVLERMQTAHDRWLELTGYDAPPIWADYPVELGEVSAQFDYSHVYECINIDPGSFDPTIRPWNPALIYHEYGHYLHQDGYTCENLGIDANAFEAYGGMLGTSFQKNGKTYSGKNNTFALTSEGGEWAAFKEAFADFVAAVCMDWDHGEYTGGMEPNLDIANVDDDKATKSVSRALWDVYDTPATRLCCWGNGDDWSQWTAIARPVGPLGSGDDDRIGADSNLGMLSLVWNVMDADWPASISELRSAVRARYGSQAGGPRVARLLDTVLRSNGLCADDIPNTAPSVTSAHVVSETMYGTAHRDVVRVYCRVTDPDTYGGMRDADHLKVRLEYGVSGVHDPSQTTWYPIGFALAEASAPPPGQSGDSWYEIHWDTRAVSPIETIFDGSAGFAWNDARQSSQITGRRENVNLRLIATDDLQDSILLVRPTFTVDNREMQGITGVVRNAGTGAALSGAAVEVREGPDSPNGTLIATTTTPAGGAYEFLGLDAGAYTVTASKPGFVPNWVGALVYEGVVTSGVDVSLTPLAANGIAQSTDGAAFLRYPHGAGLFTSVGGPWLTEGTYELWFKPRVAVSGAIAQVSLSYANWNNGAGGNAPIMELVVDNRGKLAFYVNRNDGGGPMQGDWHRLVAAEWNPGEVEARVGAWYHITAQFGGRGMRLYVNGKLQGYDPLSTGAPEADWNDGTLGGGWVSLGDNETVQPGRDTALGWFKELRVSRVQRYDADFTPPQRAANDADTVLLDHLIGGTSGQYHDFIWQP